MMTLELPAEATIVDAAVKLTGLGYRVAPGKFDGAVVEHDIRNYPLTMDPLDLAARSADEVRKLIPAAHKGPLLAMKDGVFFAYLHESRELKQTPVVQRLQQPVAAAQPHYPVPPQVAALSDSELARRYADFRKKLTSAEAEATAATQAASAAIQIVEAHEARTNRREKLLGYRKERQGRAYLDGKTANVADLDKEVSSLDAAISAARDEVDGATAALSTLVEKRDRAASKAKSLSDSAARAKARWARASQADVFGEMTAIMDQLSTPLAKLRALDQILDKADLGHLAVAGSTLRALQC